MSELQTWLNRAIETLRLLTVFLVPLVFLDRDYAHSETVIAYLEVPKVAMVRTLAGLMALLWLIDWGLHGAFNIGSSLCIESLNNLPGQWIAWLKTTLRGQPHRWLIVAVGR